MRQYIDAIVQRDVRDVASIDKLDQLPGFLRSLSEVSGQMCNYTRLGSNIGLDSKTAARYTGLKHSLTAEGRYRLLYYCDIDMCEVDVVIENVSGHLIGIEVKSSATVSAGDFRGLKKLASVSGDFFKMGVQLYDGTETMPVGDKLWAAPFSTL